MPTYEVTDSRTGLRLRLTGDSPPTDQELEQIFAAQAAPKPTVYDPTSAMSTGQRFAAGYGKVGSDLAQGTKQVLTDAINFANNHPGITANPIAGPAFGLLGMDGRALGINEDTAAQLKADADETKRLDRPLLDTRSGLVGNISGNVAAALPSAFVPGANTYTGSAVAGGLSGLMQPVGENDSRALNTGLGAGVGVLSQAAGRGLGAIYRGAKSYLAPLTKGGQDEIVANTLQRFAENPDALANAGSYQSQIPGVQPTLAEATLDPGIATLQLAAKNADPAAKAQFVRQGLNNNAARLAALEEIAQTPDARAAAVLARKQATAPLYAQVAESEAEANPTRVVNLIDRMVEANPANKALTKPLAEIRASLFEDYPIEQRGADGWKYLNDAINEKALPQREWKVLASARTIMDRVRKGTIDEDQALAQLKDLKGGRGATNDALQYVRDQMNTPDFVLMQKPQQLKSAMDNIKSMLANEDNQFVTRELTTIKNALGHQISKVEPAYKGAEKTFAELSKPINQMDVGRDLYEKLVPALTESSEIPGRLTASQYANALRNSDQVVKRATGLGMPIEKIMTPSQMQTLNGLGTDLSRVAAAEGLASTTGSTTAQNLAAQNLMRQTLGPLGAPQGWMEGQFVPNIAKAVMTPYKLLDTDAAINQRLTQVLANPKEAAALMSKLKPADQQKLIEVLSRIAVPVGIVSRPDTSQ